MKIGKLNPGLVGLSKFDLPTDIPSVCHMMESDYGVYGKCLRNSSLSEKMTLLKIKDILYYDLARKVTYPIEDALALSVGVKL